MNFEPNWKLQVDPGVYKILKRLPGKDAKKILDLLQALTPDPYSGDIQKIKAEKNVWRRRIGSYRLFFEIFPSEKSILVFHLERRTSTTY